MSFESDREQLIINQSFRPTPQSTRPPSIASVLSTASTLKPTVPARSCARPHVVGDDSSSINSSSTNVQSYRGFKSEKEYLEALRSWVEEKEYVEFDYSLIGFYGTKTSEYYKSKPGLRSPKKEKAQGRRATVAVPQSGGQSEQGSRLSPQTSKSSQGETEGTQRSRAKTLGKFFTRRGTVA